MAVGQDDLFVVEKNGDQYNIPFEDIKNNQNTYYQTLSGAHTLDHRYKNQYWKLTGDVTVLGTTQPSTGYSSFIFIFIENTGGLYDVNLPSLWDIVGTFTQGDDFEILIVEVGRYVSGPNQITGFYINSDIRTTLNNTLTSTSTVQALTANQGRVLKNLIDNIVPTPYLLKDYDRYFYNNLPASPNAGELAIVIDAASVDWRKAASGGGSDIALVMYDGTKWIYH